MTRRVGGALAAILLLALAVRLWGIRYGLPWLFYFHDEPQVVLRALRFGTGDWNPHFFIWPGILLLYLALVSYGGLFVVGKLAGWWAGKEGFAAAYFQDPTPFYLLARLWSVAFGVAGAALTFGFGRAAYSTPVGLAAALGLAVNAVHAHYSHLAHPVTAMTAFTIAGLWAAWRAATGGKPRHLYLAALTTGFGVSAQYHAGLLAVPIAIAVLYRMADARHSDGAGGTPSRWLLRGVLAGAIAIGTFLALSPYTVLDFHTFRADLSWITAKTGGEAPVTLGGSLVAFARDCLLPALGAPLAIAAACGAALALLRRTRADVLLLGFAFAYVMLASRAATLLDRYAIPLVVPALLFTARAADEVVRGMRWSESRRALAAAAAIVVLSLPVIVELVETDYTMTREDTRVASLRWFESHVPENERVVIDMLRFWNSFSPPLAENRARLVERLEEVSHGLSGAGHSSAYAEYYKFRLEHPHRPAYYLRSTDMGASLMSLEDYRRQGFRWVVVSEDGVTQAETNAARGDSAGLRYYGALERDAARVASFEPERWRRRGPGIRIYRLDPASP